MKILKEITASMVFILIVVLGMLLPLSLLTTLALVMAATTGVETRRR